MSFAVRDRKFDSGTHVMGIINVTLDSFFAASRAAADEAAERAVRMVRDGAAIIDIGAQSTRPGYTEVDADEEISRFLRPSQKLLTVLRSSSRLLFSETVHNRVQSLPPDLPTELLCGHKPPSLS